MISYITARTAKAIATAVAAVGLTTVGLTTVGLTAVTGAAVAAPAAGQASYVAAGLHVSASNSCVRDCPDNTQWHSAGG
jgi:hypothetical protein